MKPRMVQVWFDSSLAEGGAPTRIASDAAEERLDVELALRELAEEVAHLSGSHNTRRVRKLERGSNLGHLKMPVASAEKMHAPGGAGACRGQFQIAHRKVGRDKRYKLNIELRHERSDVGRECLQAAIDVRAVRAAGIEVGSGAAGMVRGLGLHGHFAGEGANGCLGHEGGDAEGND